MRRFRDLRDLWPFVREERDRRAFRRFNNMGDGQPPSLKPLLDDLGFEYAFEDMPMTESGRLEPGGFSRKGWRVVVNKNHSTLRQRFTALHEVAHYYLHHQDEDDFFASASYRSGADHFYLEEDLISEREANQFAAAVVFGDNMLEGAVGLYGENPSHLAKHFGFSPEVIKIALRDRKSP